MSLSKEEFLDITLKLQEALLSAQKMKDELLVYFVERALFHSEKITAVTFPNSKVEQSDLPAFTGYSYRATLRMTSSRPTIGARLRRRSQNVRAELDPASSEQAPTGASQDHA